MGREAAARRRRTAEGRSARRRAGTRTHLRLGDLGQELHDRHGREHDQDHEPQLGALLVAGARARATRREPPRRAAAAVAAVGRVAADGRVEGVELRAADDDRQPVAEAHHHRQRQQRDQPVELERPHHEHQHAREHHRREEELDAVAVAAGDGGLGEKRRDDRSERARRPVDHARTAAERGAHQADHPGRVQRHRRAHTGQVGEGDGLGHLRHANNDAEEDFAHVKRRRRLCLPPLLQAVLCGDRRRQREHGRLCGSRELTIACRTIHGVDVLCRLRCVRDAIRRSHGRCLLRPLRRDG